MKSGITLAYTPKVKPQKLGFSLFIYNLFNFTYKVEEKHLGDFS